MINILIVIGVAANKCDLFGQEVVTEKEGIEFAKEINATFKQTSAYSNIGIQELLRELGLRYLQKKFQTQTNEKDTKCKHNNTNNGNVKIENKSSKNNKENGNKGCCK